MLHIPASQLRALSRHRHADFVSHAVRHLRQRHPTWCEGRDDAGLRRHVAAATDFADRYDVRQEDNLLRLLDAALLPGFSARPTGYAGFRLTQAGFDETTRVLNFIAALRMPEPPLVISLQTDLQALDAQEAQLRLDALDALEALGVRHG